MDKLLELGSQVIEDAPEATKPILVMIGSVLLAEEFKHLEWLETIKEQK